jgi:DNA repair protein RadC
MPDAVETFAPKLRVEVVEDGPLNTKIQLVESPETAAEVMKLHLGRVADEHVVVLLLDAQNHLLGTITVAIGTVDSCPATPRSVLRPAIVYNAAGVIVGHNHPSGKSKPSREDLAFFAKLKRACEDMDIRFLDAIIVGDGTNELYSHRRSTFEI